VLYSLLDDLALKLRKKNAHKPSPLQSD